MKYSSFYNVFLMLLLVGGSARTEPPVISASKPKEAVKAADPNSIVEKIEDDSEVDGVHVVKGKARGLTLPIGVSRTLEFPFEIGPIYVTEPGLFDFRRVKDGGKDNKLLLLPKSSGITDMTIHDVNGSPKITYTVRVTREDMGMLMSQLEDLLGDIEGLKIRSVGGNIILDGEILLPKDMLRIIRVTDALKDRDPKKKEVPIKNLVTISKMTMNILAERIEREIGSPEITARVVNNNLFLEGTAESEFEADRALEIAKTYIPEVLVQKSKGDSVEVKPKNAGGEGGVPTIIDMMRVRPRQAAPPAQDIKITMNYVELNNEYERFFDFQWKPLASDTGSVKYDSSLGELSANLVATVTSLLPKLNQARSHGHARILKSQTIIVRDRSDAPASVNSSIDYYTRVVDNQGNPSLQRVPIANLLKVKAATLPGSDAIDLGIQVTLNSLLGTNQGAPIVASNEIQTQVTVKNGDSAALGGYGVDNALANYNREPNRNPTGGAAAAGGTPIFNMQRSKNFQRNKQQYVIFITPEVLKTASAGTEDITRKFRLNGGER
jgi:pilus assembly protein CpaC